MLKQITEYTGKRVTVEQKDGKEVVGTLAYFNYAAQVIHLNNFKIFFLDKSGVVKDKPEKKGELCVINSSNWEQLYTE